MNLLVGAQVASVGLMYLLILNGSLFVKWLVNGPVGLGSLSVGFGSVPEQSGDCRPGWTVLSIHFVVWLVVMRLASFWYRHVIGVPAWSTWVVPALACCRPTTFLPATLPHPP